MNGFSSDMMRRIIETKGEIRVFEKSDSPIENYNKYLSMFENSTKIAGVCPVVEAELLLKRGQYSTFTQAAGIDFNRHQKVSNLLQKIRLGNPDKDQLNNKGIILGSELSYQIFASIGDTIQAISPSGSIMTAFGYIPRIENLVVIGIFTTGMPEYDMSLSYISLDTAMNLKNQSGIDYFEILTAKNASSIDMVKEINKNNSHSLNAEHWSKIDSSLFSAVKIEKIAMFLILSLMLILSGFNIMNNNIRTISEKKVDLAVLKSLGLHHKKIYNSVSNMGLFIGITGTVIGEILALILLSLQHSLNFIQIPVEGFPFTSLPVALRWQDFVLFGLLSIIISYLSSLIPAKKALKYNIINVIREYE
jgi:lipoprotein-releasing system permease protein